MTRLHLEEIKKRLSKYGFEYVSGEYKNFHSTITIKDIFGYKYLIKYMDLYSKEQRHEKISFLFVHTSNPYSLENIKTYIEKNNFNFTIVDFENTTYNGKSIRNICLKCKKCNRQWFSCWDKIIKPHGKMCPYCNNRKISDSNSFLKKFPWIANEVDLVKNENFNPDNVFPSSVKEIWWRCAICKYSWKNSIKNRVYSKSGCPKCNCSYGEKKILFYLEENNIDYIYQKRFNGCKHEKKLPFDFYIERYNLCIEYNGEQHYFPSSFSKSSTKEDSENILDKIVYRDTLKKNFCFENKINLIIIPFWMVNQIEKILNKTLKDIGGK